MSINDRNLEGQGVRLIEADAIRVFVDVISGKRFERPGLADLIDHARPRDQLSVDRLGRSLRELLETVDVLKARSIHLVSLKERLDTCSAASELVFHVFGAIAHFERRFISERTRDGSAAATRALLDGIDVSNLARLRDRVFLGVLVDSFARVESTAYRILNRIAEGAAAGGDPAAVRPSGP